MEFSKCVRRHQVTKLPGLPSQPLPLRNGVTASVRPFCMSTMVPYWSNASARISRLRISGFSTLSLRSRTVGRPWRCVLESLLEGRRQGGSSFRRRSCPSIAEGPCRLEQGPRRQLLEGGVEARCRNRDAQAVVVVGGDAHSDDA